MSPSSAGSNGSRSWTSRCRAEAEAQDHDDYRKEYPLRGGACRRGICGGGDPSGRVGAGRGDRGEDRGENRQLRLRSATHRRAGQHDRHLDQRRRRPAYGRVDHQALQVERARYHGQILVHVRDAGNLRILLFPASAHDRNRGGRGSGRGQRGAMMLDRPQRLTLVAASKPESKAPGSANVDDDGKARRFRDAALPHLDDVYTLARYMLRNATDAEDAVQECYLRALRHFDTYRGPAMKPWLFAILRNVCRSEFVRRSGVALTIDGRAEENEDAVPLWQETPLSPEANMLRQWDAETIRRLVAELPDLFREAIVLREINDLSYSEIADVVGVPIGTVMSRLSRARSLLRRAWMAEEGART